MAARKRWLWVAGLLALLLPAVARAIPPVEARVAVFFDPAYVDQVSAFPNAEGPNVRAALTAQGFAHTIFAGVSEAAWRNATNDTDVIVIPELELAALAPALAANARNLLRDFVTAGGTLVIHGDNSGNASGLLNQTFGFATVLPLALKLAKLLAHSVEKIFIP